MRRFSRCGWQANSNPAVDARPRRALLTAILALPLVAALAGDVEFATHQTHSTLATGT
ncbi:MAG: hypothetical protein ACRDSF_07205 [Pseudonocardiaceae bacterium]